MSAQKFNNADITIARIHHHIKFNNLPLKLIYRKYPKQFDMLQNKEVLPFMWVGNTAKLFRRAAVNMLDYGLVANEDLAINYFNYVKYHNMAANNHSIYTIRVVGNSLAEHFIRQNLSYIENTIIPLENELNLFLANGYYEEFYDELEAIYIRNILERIDNIKTNTTVNSIQKGQLITILIEYLNFNFPNWLNNKYYKKNFIDGSIAEIYFALTTRKQIRECYSSFQSPPLETIESYKKVLKN